MARDIFAPTHQTGNCIFYCRSLIDDGFDSLDMLGELMEDDVRFVKPFNASTFRPSFIELSPRARDVYTVDKAVGGAALKGIEATIQEGKRASIGGYECHDDVEWPRQSEMT